MEPSSATAWKILNWPNSTVNSPKQNKQFTIIHFYRIAARPNLLPFIPGRNPHMSRDFLRSPLVGLLACLLALVVAMGSGASP